MKFLHVYYTSGNGHSQDFIHCVCILPNCDSSYQYHIITALRNLPSDYDIIITGDFNTPDRHFLAFTIRPTTFLQRYLLYFLLSKPPTANKIHIGNMCAATFYTGYTNSPDWLSNVIVDEKNKFCRSDHYFYFFSFDAAAINIHQLDLWVQERPVLLYSRADFTCLIIPYNFTYLLVQQPLTHFGIPLKMPSCLLVCSMYQQSQYQVTKVV